jgi:hypothetical protein
VGVSVPLRLKRLSCGSCASITEVQKFCEGSERARERERVKGGKGNREIDRIRGNREMEGGERCNQFVREEREERERVRRREREKGEGEGEGERNRERETERETP